MHSHIGCAVKTARINGRTLKQALESTQANHRFGNFSSTEWVDVCPKCDAYALGGEFTHPWPFLCHDGVMRTVADFDADRDEYISGNMEFAGFKFSESALESAIENQFEYSTTQNVEKAGTHINQKSKPADLLQFSQLVCDWGRGQRVWANLLRHNSRENLAAAYSNWFSIAKNSPDVQTAIEPGINIKGMGISFASKHLRMLAPEKFAVLDDVISEGLGFALNQKGYQLFMQLLGEFLNKNHIKHNLATLESGLFLLVRQQVRAK